MGLMVLEIQGFSSVLNIAVHKMDFDNPQNKISGIISLFVH